MRATILPAALTVLLAGCGFDPAPTAPDDAGLPLAGAGARLSRAAVRRGGHERLGDEGPDPGARGTIPRPPC